MKSAPASEPSHAPRWLDAFPAITGDMAIATDNLTKRFGKRNAVEAIAMRVPRGSTYGLIGLNGAGKSTTIRMIMGLVEPTSGKITLNGRHATGLAWESRLGVGYVPDRCVVHPWMRVSEAIAFCKALQPRWNDAHSKELLERYRLDPAQRVSMLSKGLAAKLSLLLALSHDPDILILDEPTDGLDPLAKDDFLEGVLASACERSRTILMSSHNLADVQRMADYVGLMYEGRLAVQCPAEELVRSTKRVRMLLQDTQGPATRSAGAIHTRREGRELVVTVGSYSEASALEIAREASATVLTVEDMSLDDIFKDFVRGQEIHS